MTTPKIIPPSADCPWQQIEHMSGAGFLVRVPDYSVPGVAEMVARDVDAREPTPRQRARNAGGSAPTWRFP